MRRGVLDALLNRSVSVPQAGVLAKDADADRFFARRDNRGGVARPRLPSGIFGRDIYSPMQVEDGKDFAVEAFSSQRVGNHINGFSVVHAEHPMHGHIAEHGDLFHGTVRNWILAAAGNQMRLDPSLHLR